MLSDALRDPDECRYLECTLESSLTAIGHNAKGGACRRVVRSSEHQAAMHIYQSSRWNGWRWSRSGSGLVSTKFVITISYPPSARVSALLANLVVHYWREKERHEMCIGPATLFPGGKRCDIQFRLPHDRQAL